ncbi:condensation domain-containing protein, partial [Streptomyces sp. NRRL B-3229]|uniref:condensation domain-containing protein n=1 Tax=Streptomyces sp. NRRL B-3229 TaxID=1463836 RepID=UPI0004C2ABA6
LDGYSQPLQLVHGTVEIPLAVHDIRALSADEQREAAQTYVEGERAAGFNLAAAPQVRIAVHIESDDSWRLTFSYQHAMADGWTLNSLLMELLECYRGVVGGQGLPAYEAPAVRYADFVLLAAHLKVLGMLTAEDAFHTGVVYHGRLEAPGADRVLGMHLNTLPFPSVKGAGTWRELVEEVYRQETEIWSHRRYPLPAIQRAAGGSGGDLLTILFEYLDFHQVDRETVDMASRMGDGSNEFALNAIAGNDGFSLVGSTDVVDRANLDRLAGMYRSVLEAMAADADGDARGVLLSGAERGVLLGEWADGSSVGWPGGLVVDRFEAQ